MIKAKRGAVTLKGTAGVLLTDYMCISKSILQALTGNGFTREESIAEMKKVQEHALMTDDEIDAEMRRLLLNVAKDIAGILEEDEDHE